MIRYSRSRWNAYESGRLFPTGLSLWLPHRLLLARTCLGFGSGLGLKQLQKLFKGGRTDDLVELRPVVADQARPLERDVVDPPAAVGAWVGNSRTSHDSTRRAAISR